MAYKSTEEERKYALDYYYANKEKCKALYKEWQTAKKNTHIETSKDGVTTIHIHRVIPFEMEAKVQKNVKHNIYQIFGKRQYIVTVDTASVDIMFLKVDEDFNEMVLKATEMAIEEALNGIKTEEKRARGRGRKIAQYELDGAFIRYWKGVTEIQKTIGYNVASISNCCNGRTKQAYGYKWKYVDSEAD